MTPEDRDLLLSLRHQQADLQQTLERLNAQLGALEARAGEVAPGIFPPLPPLPLEPTLPPLPPLDAPEIAEVALPPIPTASVIAALPPIPTTPAPSFEFQFGRWLTRLGVLFGVIALALVLALPKVQALLGHAGLLAISAAVSLGVVIVGNRLERRGAAALIFGHAFTVMGLAWLSLTAYAACYDERLRVIGSPLVAGLVLLLWSIYVLLLAERKKSQFLALFAITLAYVGTSLNPVSSFTMGTDLILAATAMVFLLRHGWTTLATASLIGTYYALLRKLLIDENGDLVFDTSRTIHYAPYAVYLVFAWLIFTTAIILTSAPDFRGVKRLGFLCLNNGALAGILALTAYIAGYGSGAIGWTLLDAGFVFLIVSRFAGFAEIEPVDLMAAYAAHGLALVTAGLIIVSRGIARAFLLLLETFLLGVAGAFSGDRVLTISTYVAAFFATFFSIWEIAVYAHHPWLLGFGGAIVMLINAWSSRSEIRHSPVARSTIVVSTSCYCILALGLIFTALSTELSDSTLPPALALAALALTYIIYHFSIFELPALAQTLLLTALVLVLFPAETGEELPWWSPAWVGVITLLLVTWWSRQRTTRSGAWTTPLTFVYALALVGLAVQAVRPYLDAQGWMIGASFLSVVFLVYGAFTRVWPVAAMGQILLGLALCHIFFPPQSDVFPWAWWAAAMPVVVLFATARAAHEWLRLFPETPASWRATVRLLADGYQLVALAALARLVFAVVPASDQMAAFLFLGTLLLSMNVRYPSTFGVRCSFVLSAIGMWLYLETFPAQATFLNGFAMLLFLAQTALLRHEGKSLVTRLESWTLILFAVGTSWLFVSAWVMTRLSPAYLTMGWALYALFLFLFGLFVWEPRLRWCGMALVVVAILRVGACDMWGLSGGYRVLTFLLLALITLGIGYILLRRDSSVTSNERNPS